MKYLFALLTVLSFNSVQAKDWSLVKCPNKLTLAQEFLRAEAAGWRVTDAKQRCFTKDQFAYFPIHTGEDRGEGRNPLVLDEQKPFELKDVQPQKDGSVAVHFRWRGLDGTLSAPQTLLFRPYFEKMKKHLGCAGLIAGPELLAARKSCLQ